MKLVRSFFTMTFIMLCGAGILRAQTATAPSGSGTSGSPYLITSLENLYWIADQANNQSNNFENKFFIQTADINASSTSTWSIGAGWTPISGTTTDFFGSYNGQGHVISGLYIYRPSDDCVGLFGSAGKGTIQNLGLTNVSITGHANVGGFIGYLWNTATVNNCYATGSVTATNQCGGGLIGTDDGAYGTDSNTVSQCYSTCTVSGADFTGGLIGEAYSLTTTFGTITDCYATGAVTSSGVYTGGLIGWAGIIGTVSNCHAVGSVTTSGVGEAGGLIGLSGSGTVNNCYATGAVTSPLITSADIGGLIGSASSLGTVSNCYATGAITAGATYVNGSGSMSKRIGGLIGSNSSAVSGCYATGSTYGGNDIGGLIGLNDSTVSDCYSTGTITDNGYNGFDGGLIGRNTNTISTSYSISPIISVSSGHGGFVGSNQTGGVINSTCFWNTDIYTNGVQYVDGGTSAAVGKTTGALKTQSTFSGWRFDSTWAIRADSTYPGLRKLDNAPFAFADTLKANRTFAFSRLLLNDCDLETAKKNLLVNLVSTTLGTTGVNTLTFPLSIANNKIDTLKYRVGETRTADTLWGNIATAIITLDTTMLNGSGTIADPYLVTSYTDLKTVGTTSSLSAVYRLIADIDASASATEHSDSGFVPIGNSSSKFTGTFHGAGHVIRHLSIKRPTTDYVGLFGYINGGTIDSLGLIDNVIVGQNYVGGIMGANSPGSAISYCYNTGAVSGSASRVGGIVGYNYSTTISNCYNTGKITSSSSYVGGIVGYIEYPYTGGTTVSYCYNTGAISGSVNEAGGINGCSYGAAISNCYNTGTISGTASFVGGITGWNTGNNSNCYNTGNVSGTSYIGGIIGYIPSGTTNYCYTTGSVAGSSNAGGIVGLMAGGNIQYSYWDTQASGQGSAYATNNGGTVSSVTGLTTAQMKKSSNLGNLNFTSIWKIRNDSTYAGLQAVSDNAPFAFTDTLKSTRTFTLSKLLLNDCDIETVRQKLTLKVTSASAGITDSVSTLTFPYSIANGKIDTVKYRVGEIRSTIGDTLWGNIATAFITLDTVVTAVESNTELSVPKEFALSQNYPNPFNPTTRINFTLAQDGFTTLNVYDILGREVATLVNGEMKAGVVNTATFNASKLSSGIYFSRLESSGSMQMRKLMLVK